MIWQIDTIEQLRTHLEGKTSEYEKMMADLDAKRAMDAEHSGPVNMQYWLAWNATALLGAATEARLAADVRAWLGADIPEEEKIRRIRAHATERALGSKPRVDSRSTLVASNLADDHEHAFWVELAGLMRERI